MTLIGNKFIKLNLQVITITTLSTQLCYMDNEKAIPKGFRFDKTDLENRKINFGSKRLTATSENVADCCLPRGNLIFHQKNCKKSFTVHKGLKGTFPKCCRIILVPSPAYPENFTNSVDPFFLKYLLTERQIDSQIDRQTNGQMWKHNFKCSAEANKLHAILHKKDFDHANWQHAGSVHHTDPPLIGKPRLVLHLQ